MDQQINKEPDLKDIVNQVFKLLRRSAQTGSDLHYPVLSTISEGKARLRKVVLRDFDAATAELFIHTDLRSHKIKNIKKEPHVSLLFWDPDKRVQLQVFGKAIINHLDVTAKKHWDYLPDIAKRTYGGPFNPGSIISEYMVNEAINVDSETINKEAFHHFVVLRIEIEEIEYLKLRKEGHVRARLNAHNGAWKAIWLAA